MIGSRTSEGLTEARKAGVRLGRPVLVTAAEPVTLTNPGATPDLMRSNNV